MRVAFGHLKVSSNGLVELWTPHHSGLMSEGHFIARVLLSHELKTAPVLLSHTQGCSGLVESRTRSRATSLSKDSSVSLLYTSCYILRRVDSVRLIDRHRRNRLIRVVDDGGYFGVTGGVEMLRHDLSSSAAIVVDKTIPGWSLVGICYHPCCNCC